MTAMAGGNEDRYCEDEGQADEGVQKRPAGAEDLQDPTSPGRSRPGDYQAAGRINVRGRGVYIGRDAIGSALGDYSQVHNEIVFQEAREVQWPMRIGAVPPLASAYQERPALREQIDTARFEGRGVVLAPVLAGEGGIGKTQLAASYAHRAETELVLWVTASDVSQVVADYARAARLVGAPGAQGHNAEDDARAFLEWLAATDRSWLIILDNVHDAAALTPWWPAGRGNQGWVLATTRRRDAQGAGRRRVDIGLYTPDEARTYLTQRLKSDNAAHLADDHLDALAEALGYLPLALGHAAAYLVNEGVTANDYLRLLLAGERRLNELLPADADVDGYGRTVTTALLLNLHAADQRCPHPGLAQHMLQICALLDPAGHPEGLWGTEALRQYLGNQLRRNTPSKLGALLPRALRPQGTKKKKAQRPRRHHPRPGQLKFVWTSTLSPEEQNKLEKQIRARFAQSDPSQLSPSNPSNPFRDAVARAMHSAPVQLEQQEMRDTLRLLHRFSLLTHVPSEPHRSINIHTLTARTIRETYPTEYNVTYAAADALQQVWTHDASDAQFTRALEDNTVMLTRHCGQMLCEPDVHPLLWKAGRSIGESGQMRAAAEFFAQLLPLVTAALGPNHRGTLTTRNNAATWQGRAGDAAGAAQAFADLLSDQQRIGLDHRETLATRNNLAQWRERAGDPIGAVQSCAETLADAEQTLGRDDRLTLLIRQNLTVLKFLAGLADESVQTLSGVLSSQQRKLPPDHPNTLSVRLNLASARAHEGDHAGAAEELAELLPLLERARGPHHPETLTARINLASARGEIEGATIAVETLTEILVDIERFLGSDHPYTLIARSKLADARGEAGDPAGAVQAYAELLTYEQQLLGHDHPHSLITHNNLADWRGEAGDAAGAAEAFADLCPRIQRAFGASHPYTLTAFSSLARWRREAGDVAGADEALAELLLRAQGDGHPESPKLQDVLALWPQQQDEDMPEA